MAAVAVFAILLSVLVGMGFSQRITGPVRKLAEGARRISRGDLGYKVRVKGPEELKELAQEFNTMAEDLSVSQKKNHDYFYSVIQSLVRIVEAKDGYTRGHSERVAEYAERLANRLGLPAQLVRKSCLTLP